VHLSALDFDAQIVLATLAIKLARKPVKMGFIQSCIMPIEFTAAYLTIDDDYITTGAGADLQPPVSHRGDSDRRWQC
jgi:hypothetical protein